ncbi:hypothetical protein MY7_3826 [Bacillus sp. 5B6]|jgi:hypothetical protein|nr:hypothetical protein MY7_3826 [Bacillus sp. 5B6]
MFILLTDNIINIFLKIAVVIVGPVDLWISCEKDRKHSLSTCGQTVYGYEKVIHTFPDSSEDTII